MTKTPEMIATLHTIAEAHSGNEDLAAAAEFYTEVADRLAELEATYNAVWDVNWEDVDDSVHYIIKYLREAGTNKGRTI